jgi:hypothetical protein
MEIAKSWRVVFNAGDSHTRRIYVVLAPTMWDALEKGHELDRSSLNEGSRFSVSVERGEDISL